MQNHTLNPEAPNPKGVVKQMPTMRNGWQETVKAGDSGCDSLPPGVTQLDVARAMAGKNELIWKTRPVPEGARAMPEYAVVWRGGMGYFAEPQGRFALYVDGTKVIDIPAISERDAEWFSADKTARLTYVRDPSTAEYGTFTLTLPSSKVTPGKTLLLKAVGSDSGIRRWLGVFQTW